MNKLILSTIFFGVTWGIGIPYLKADITTNYQFVDDGEWYDNLIFSPDETKLYGTEGNCKIFSINSLLFQPEWSAISWSMSSLKTRTPFGGMTADCFSIQMETVFPMKSKSKWAQIPTLSTPMATVSAT